MSGANSNGRDPGAGPTRPSMDGGTPSFVKPFLYALSRIQENEQLTPTQYTDRARRLMIDRLGMEGPMPEAAFSHGTVAVVADHTTYFPGFALLLHLRQGLAVAVRPNDKAESRFVSDASDRIQTFDIAGPADPTTVGGLLAELVRSAQIGGGTQWDVSFLAGLPPGVGIAYYSTLSVAVLRALHMQEGRAFSDADVRDQAQSALEKWLGRPVSRAYVIAALATDEAPFLLIDTKTGEMLSVDVPPAERPGWAIVDTHVGDLPPTQAVVDRRAQAHRAVQDLKDHWREDFESLRDLAHKDLESAIHAVPRRSKSVLRHLVSENRNAQQLVVAIRRKDWQYFGGVMMISQASKRTDWTTVSRSISSVVERADEFGIEGIYGAVQTGESGSILILGRPFSLPAFLDSVREADSPHTERQPDTFIL